jgi:hypothetical protein
MCMTVVKPVPVLLFLRCLIEDLLDCSHLLQTQHGHANRIWFVIIYNHCDSVENLVKSC